MPTISMSQASPVACWLVLELLAHGAPINSLVLKQYRAGDDVGKACYQALVRTQRSIQRIYDLREIEERVHVRLHRYPGHPIAQTLGLQVKSVDSAGGEVVQNLQPLHPFWMRISVREEQAVDIATGILAGFGASYRRHWLAGVRAKLGLQEPGDDEADAALATDWLALLQDGGIDYTPASAPPCSPH